MLGSDESIAVNPLSISYLADETGPDLGARSTPTSIYLTGARPRAVKCFRVENTRDNRFSSRLREGFTVKASIFGDFRIKCSRRASCALKSTFPRLGPAASWPEMFLE